MDIERVMGDVVRMTSQPDGCLTLTESHDGYYGVDLTITEVDALIEYLREHRRSVGGMSEATAPKLKCAVCLAWGYDTDAVTITEGTAACTVHLAKLTTARYH